MLSATSLLHRTLVCIPRRGAVLSLPFPCTCARHRVFFSYGPTRLSVGRLGPKCTRIPLACHRVAAFHVRWLCSVPIPDDNCKHEEDWFSEKPVGPGPVAPPTDKDAPAKKPRGTVAEYVDFLAGELCVSSDRAAKILKECKGLTCVPTSALRAAFKTLDGLGYSRTDVADHAKVLLLSDMSIEKRDVAFREIGFADVTLDMLVKYKTIFYTTPAKGGALWRSLRTALQLFEYDTTAEAFVDLYPELKNGSLYTLRRVLRRHYLVDRLRCTPPETAQLGQCYSRTNLTVIKHNLDLLLNEVGFTIDKIKRNRFLLDIKTANARRVLREMPRLLGDDFPVLRVVWAHPKILYQTVENVTWTIETLLRAGVTARQVALSGAILTLHPATVASRIERLERIPEVSLMRTDDKYVNLIHHFNKVSRRLQQLKDLDYPYVSLTMLYSAESLYRRALEKGWNSGALLQSARFIRARCGGDERVIVRRLREQCRHTRLVNPANARAVMEHLFAAGVTTEQFVRAVGVVQYDIALVEHHWGALCAAEELRPLADWLAHDNLVHLLIYYVERDMGYIDLEHARFEKFAPAYAMMPGVACGSAMEGGGAEREDDDEEREEEGEVEEEEKEEKKKRGDVDDWYR
ncbi:PREDICTED: uncharacterized protein LOC106807724 [Priapulus caudatus]|uniref:Uncharacterized protein LOC106807724 n=1 Tax=Priapulus caudatus TaxID=37621 RepID=A0ABM1E0C4_PRICU|nr:PREDICTED: uncharacterized protein LOC106807724 [Priapulus caudatus]